MLERIARPVDARTLAVPHGEHALHLGARFRFHLLRPEDRRGGQILVDRRQELDPVLGKALFRLPELEVERAQRRAAVARDEAPGLESRIAVPAGLVEKDARQGLRACQEDAAARLLVAVGQAIVGEIEARNGH